jgi:hypothetical protein
MAFRLRLPKSATETSAQETTSQLAGNIERKRKDRIIIRKIFTLYEAQNGEIFPKALIFINSLTVIDL